MPFQEGNQEQRKGHKSKPFRDALRVAIADFEGDPKALRKVAEALISKAMSGDVAAIREVADRLDGKVPQAIVGDEDGGPILVKVVKYDDGNPPSK